MINWLNIIALFVFGAMIVVAVWFRRKTRKQSPAFSCLPGIAIAALSVGAWAVTFQWYLDPATLVVGFPFTAGVLEFHNGRWVDFVGAITLPAMAANLVFWLLLFRLPLMWYKYLKKEPHPSSGDGSSPHADTGIEPPQK